MSVSSSAEYWALLRKSNAFDQTSLDEIASKHSDVTDPRQLARLLVSEQHLSEWQARSILSGRHRLKIGKYSLLDRIPAQSMGDRFLGMHPQLNRKVDVLVFPKGAAHNQDLIQQFLDQASSVARLDHRNLLHLYDIDKENNRYFLVFEHDDGNSLKTATPGSLDARQIASIARQSLDGIAYAHARNIVHGKLDESQIRVDDKGQVSIRNTGLVKLLDQLQQPLDQASQSDSDIDPVGDVGAIGRICQELYRKHAGQPITDQEKELYRLFGEIGGATDGRQQQTKSLVTRLDAWMDQFDREMGSLQHPEPIRQTDTPSSKTTPARTVSGAPSTKSRASFSNRKTWLSVVGFVILCGIIGGVWSALADDNSGDHARSERLPDETSEEFAERTAATRLAGKDKSRIAEDIGNSTSTENLRNQPANPDSEIQPASGSRRVSTTGEKREVDSGNIGWRPTTAVNDAVNNDPAGSNQEEDKRPGTRGIVFDGAEGLPWVEWTEASKMIDQEAVVYGMIKSVGSAGTYRFLNFKTRRDRKAFTIVVHTRDIDKSDSELREMFDEKNILVRGKIELYERDETPQIKLVSLDQIRIVDQLPSPDSTMIAGGTGSPAVPVVSAKSGSVFGRLNRGFSIPELSRETKNFNKVLLGQVDIGEDPMGMFLTVPEEACVRPVYFGIQRDERTGKRWEILFAPRIRDAEALQTPVAEILLEDNQLFFRWLESDNIDSLVNYLQNCLLELKAPEESKTVLLRRPEEVAPILLDEKKPMFKERLGIRHLPQREAIGVEIVELPVEEFETQVSDFGRILTVDQPETVIFLDKLPENQFFRLWYSADITTSIKIESALQINSPDKPLIFNKKNLKTLEDLLLTEQANLSRLNAEAIAYEPPYGEKTKHKERMKKISEQLEMVNSQVAAFQVARPLAKRLVGRELHYRVFFTVGDIEFDLLVSRSKAITTEPSSNGSAEPGN